jgi:SAM-dependent MidA family methyltransferase
VVDRDRVGALPELADWMRHGLYDPEAGYYAAGRVRFGHQADFWTFPTRLSPSFGALLAEHLAGLRARLVVAGDLGPDEPFDVIELGAGTGALACDVLDAAAAMAAQREPFAGLARTLRYRIGERAPALREQQRRRLGARPAEHLEQGPGDLLPALAPVTGVIVHNELLDVWPHSLLRPSGGQRLTLDAGLSTAELPQAMREAYAAAPPPASLRVVPSWRAEAPPADPYLQALRETLAWRGAAAEAPPELLYAPDLPGFVAWAAQTLRAGWMLTIDYGGDVTHALDPAPALAQLRLFPQPVAPPRRAPAVAALAALDWPGRQDITVDIDFSHLAWAGLACGLRPVLHGPQGLLGPTGSLASALGTVTLDLLAAPARRRVEAQLQREQGVGAIEAARLTYQAARTFLRGSAGFRLLLQERDGTAGGLRGALARAPDAFPVLPDSLPRLRPDARAAAVVEALGDYASAFALSPLRPAGSLVTAIDEAGLRSDLAAVLRALEPVRSA